MKRDWYLHDERADYEVIALSGCAQPSLLLRSSLMTLFRKQYLVDNDPVSPAMPIFSGYVFGNVTGRGLVLL